VDRVTENTLQGDDQLGLGKQVPLRVLDELRHILEQTTVSVDVDTITHAEECDVTHLLLPAEATQVVQHGLIVVLDGAQGHSVPGWHLGRSNLGYLL